MRSFLFRGLFACVVGCGSSNAGLPPDGGEIHDGSADDHEASSPSDAGTPTGLLVPLYTYPTDGTWAALIQAKSAHPSVPIVAVINPNSGPGTSKSTDYATGITSLEAGGVRVIGYVPTGYGTSSYSAVADVEKEISDYVTWYPNIEGIFFDEMSSDAGEASYYQTLATYVGSLGLSLTVGNPGANVPEALLGIFTNIVIYESSGMPAQSSIDSYYSKYGAQPFSFIAYGVASLPSLKSLSTYVRWLYVTDLGGANPYGALPSYFDAEVGAL